MVSNIAALGFNSFYFLKWIETASRVYEHKNVSHKKRSATHPFPFASSSQRQQAVHIVRLGSVQHLPQCEGTTTSLHRAKLPLNWSHTAALHPALARVEQSALQQ